MKNMNKDYIVDVNVKTSTVSASDNLKFAITDKNTSNIFFRLILNESSNSLINSYAPNEDASNYKLTLRIVKPPNQPLYIEATLLDQGSNFFIVDLPDDYKDVVGVYQCELFIDTEINGRLERSTTNSFTYTVKKSIMNDLDGVIEGDPDYPLFERLVDQLKDMNINGLDAYATEAYVAEQLKTIDTTSYVPTSVFERTIENYALANHTHDQYLTEQSLSGYATTSYVSELINDIQLGDGTFFSSYALKTNPEFVGSISMDRKEGTTIGLNSFAVGCENTASGMYSFAEGYCTVAEGWHSHAEGNTCKATGNVSHAEGEKTQATVYGAHAEGCNTIAGSVYQHVEGKYNIEDTDEIYAHIVGNGTNEASRSNAYTLDWNGNAWFAGKVTAGADPTEDMDLVTKTYVDTAISNISSSGDVDLSPYALKSEIPTSLPANGGNADTVDGCNIWTGTQAEFNAIATKNANTIYIVKEG